MHNILFRPVTKKSRVVFSPIFFFLPGTVGSGRLPNDSQGCVNFCLQKTSAVYSLNRKTDHDIIFFIQSDHCDTTSLPLEIHIQDS